LLEKRIENLRPDLYAFKGKTPLIIEIKYSHGIDRVKMEKIKKLGISTLEIDLSDMDINFE
jgi:Holliday junction resolvase